MPPVRRTYWYNGGKATLPHCGWVVEPSCHCKNGATLNVFGLHAERIAFTLTSEPDVTRYVASCGVHQTLGVLDLSHRFNFVLTP